MISAVAALRNAGPLGLRRRTSALLLLLFLLSTVFESFGLGMLLPVVQIVQAGGDAARLIADSTLWKWLGAAYDLIGLEPTLPVLLATSFIAIVLRQGFVYLRLVYTSHATLSLSRGIRDRIFRALIGARLAATEGDRQGRVINDLTVEVDRATQCVMSVIALGGQMILGVTYLGFMVALSPAMTGVALPILAAAAIPVLILMRRSTALGEGITEANRTLADFLVQRLRSLRLIRLSGTEPAEQSALGRHTAQQFDRVYRSNVMIARTKVMVEPVIVAAGFAFLYFGVGTFGIGIEEIGFFIIILLRLMPVLREAMLTRQTIMVTAPGLDGVSRRLGELRDNREGAGGRRAFTALDRAIGFEDVGYCYDGGERPALRGVTLEIPARRLTALVGPSGAGKSTLIDLLPRLRDPQTGRVLLDGIALQDFSLRSLRAGISYAPQSPQIFDVTAAEHIRYGRPDASHGEIERAARLAGGHDFIIALPQGYDTPVGEGGTRLSGGQRQRLDLARALLREAPILILDEPTNQLDADAEDRFREALLRIRDETAMTIIVVAHRLSTVALADRIVVLSEGRVADTGSHVELLARGGWYAEAYAKQQGGGLARSAGGLRAGSER